MSGCIPRWNWCCSVDGAGWQRNSCCYQQIDGKYDLAIWAHHGTFAAGEDFDLTFGLMHTAEKSAEILVKMLSMQSQKRQTIQPDEFRHLAKILK